MSVYFGAGGHARELAWLAFERRAAGGIDDTPTLHVVADDDPLAGGSLRGVPVIPDSSFFGARARGSGRAILAIGAPLARQRLVERLRKEAPDWEFPVMVHPGVAMDMREGGVRLGPGVYVCAGSSLTTDITIAEFCHLNVGCTIAHDVALGPFNTVSPGVHVAGRVRTGTGVVLGIGVSVRDGVRISSGVVVGAGAVVVGDLSTPGTYVGIPARLRTGG